MDATGDADSITLTEQFKHVVCDDFRDLDVSAEQISITSTTTGYGAAGLTVLVAIGGVFFLGKRIQENIDAWLDLGAKLQAVVKKLHARHGEALLSEPAALALALRLLEEGGHSLKNAELMDSECFPVHNGVIPAPMVEKFSSQPDRFYLFAFEDGNSDVLIICLRSSGEVEFIHRLPTGNYLEYFGVVRHSSQNVDLSSGENKAQSAS
jgi:hypothetical protein